MRGFELADGQAVTALPPSAQRLVAFLALQRCPVLRVFVAGTLWPETSDRQAAARLRSTVWRVQRVGCAVLDANSTHLALSRAATVDFHAVAVAALTVIRGTALRWDDVDALCGSQDLLPDWYDDWLAIERERFRQLRLHGLEALAVALARRRRYAEAGQAALAAVAADPLRESAHRALITVHLAEGNVWEARRQYDRFADLTRTCLGTAPSGALQHLVE
jgi:DNA-binding SARP family transcriptional activator